MKAAVSVFLCVMFVETGRARAQAGNEAQECAAVPVAEMDQLIASFEGQPTQPQLRTKVTALTSADGAAAKEQKVYSLGDTTITVAAWTLEPVGVGKWKYVEQEGWVFMPFEPELGNGTVTYDFNYSRSLQLSSDVGTPYVPFWGRGYRMGQVWRYHGPNSTTNVARPAGQGNAPPSSFAGPARTPRSQSSGAVGLYPGRAASGGHGSLGTSSRGGGGRGHR
jgi:hypothetical protein